MLQPCATFALNKKLIDMKRTLFTALLLASLALANAQRVNIQTENMSLVISAEIGKQPEFVYFGSPLNPNETQTVPAPTGGRMDAYPAYGMNTPAPADLACKHADGNVSTQIPLTETEITQNLVTINMKEKALKLKIDL